MTDDNTQLGVIHAGSECGSGAPMEGFLLLELRQGLWTLGWTSAQDDRTRLGHRTIEFISGGLDSLRITGDSWLRGDAQSKIFHESNAGPHRYFDQTWRRIGDKYTFVEERVEPSAYNTLVDFVYALSLNDEDAAAKLTTNPQLTGVARELGLAPPPDTTLGLGWCEVELNGSGRCTIQTTTVNEQNVVTERNSVRATIVSAGTDWLISEIAPCTYIAFANGGSRCD